VDIPEAHRNIVTLTAQLQDRGYSVFPISAVTGEGVQELLQAVAAVLREVQQHEAEIEKPQERRRYTLENVDERAWNVDRLSRHHFAVTGIGIERFTRMTDFSRDEAVERFQRLLESSGISNELGRLGVEAGDVVHIADIELVWGDQEELQPLETKRGKK
jgi:GTP-binding protein